MGIKIHSSQDFAKMRVVGKMAGELLVFLRDFIKPGISTLEIDSLAVSFIKKLGAISACLGYKGRGCIPFPASICTSPNYTVCHGVPCNYILKPGDIISIDVTLIFDGWHGDTCHTFCVGEISSETHKLVEITREARRLGIEAAVPGNFIGDIGFAIRNLVNRKFGIVRDYCGHGIGRTFHAEPEIIHDSLPKTGEIIREGMFFTVEPMINLGSGMTRLLNDNWTVISKDYSLSAQFEHTIGITPNGPEIFTLSELDKI